LILNPVNPFLIEMSKWASAAFAPLEGRNELNFFLHWKNEHCASYLAIARTIVNVFRIRVHYSSKSFCVPWSRKVYVKEGLQLAKDLR